MNSTFTDIETISRRKKQNKVFPVGATWYELFVGRDRETLNRELEELENSGLIGSYSTLNSRFYFIK
jgi:hypothetical protein